MKDMIEILVGIIKSLPGVVTPVDDSVLVKRLESNRELQRYLQLTETGNNDWQAAMVGVMLTLIRIARRLDQPNLEQAFEVLQEALHKGGKADQVASAVAMLKNVALQLETGCKTGTPETGLAPAEDGKPEAGRQEDVSILKDIFLELLTELDLDLGNEYREELQNLRREVVSAKSQGHLLQNREAVKNILGMYAQYFHQERSRAEAFVSEVADHITELEKFLMTSVGYLKNSHQSGHDFTSRLAAEVAEVKNSIMGAPDPMELRHMILAKLKNLNALIADKKRQDQTRDQAFTPELKRFRRHFGTIQEEVARVQQENQELLEKLQTDCLTSAYNRVYYEKCLRNEFSRFQRYQRPFSLVVFDLDNFKRINDGFGHNIGDKCLIELAREVKSILRAGDPLIRYGGDEFVILLPETGLDQAVQVAEKIRESIQKTGFLVRGRPLPLTVSLGVAEVTGEDQDYKTVVDRADRALYLAKDSGRNQVKTC
jgi:diguanylate cyclase (GGDEF)-like protein